MPVSEHTVPLPSKPSTPGHPKITDTHTGVSALREAQSIVHGVAGVITQPLKQNGEATSLAVKSVSSRRERYRALNRGWSEQGKHFRALERKAAATPGTFYFSHLLYADDSAYPTEIETVLLRRGKFARRAVL